ncbi:MAG: histidine phosphatase family protein [Pseudomonadota bacterium]
MNSRPLPTLAAMRHAPIDAPGRCYGRADLLPSISHEAAIDRIPRDQDANLIWSSPAERCRGPGALQAARTGVSHRIDARLHELDFGQWENRPWDELPRAELDAWGAAWEHEAPPGGEALPALEARVRGWHAELHPGARHLLIAHAGVVRALWVIRHGCAWPEAMDRPVPHLTLLEL